MIRTALPLARDLPSLGYDVIGVTAIDCRNDGTAVRVISERPAPARDEHHHYERMIRAICAEFRDRFRN